MTIIDDAFENERELESWMFANSQTFFGQSIVQRGFRIATPTGKFGIPDGFAFNFQQRQWWVIECELLKHGVWPHIAEQITRFVVAARNGSTLRQVRDKVFEKILADGNQDSISAVLQTNTTRLLQQLELFVESVNPSLAIFIDETNQDLDDFCDALDIPSEIYRVKKFIVNGTAEYYSPDKFQPAVTHEPDIANKGGSAAFDVIEALGGGEVLSGRNRCYRLHDGRIIKVQYSKLHEKHQVYWYGINPSSYEQAKQQGCTHYAFVMGSEGFVVLPLSLVDRYLATAHVTNNVDGTVRHFHLHLTQPPDVALRGYGNAADIDVSREFESA